MVGRDTERRHAWDGLGVGDGVRTDLEDQLNRASLSESFQCIGNFGAMLVTHSFRKTIVLVKSPQPPCSWQWSLAAWQGRHLRASGWPYRRSNSSFSRYSILTGFSIASIPSTTLMNAVARAMFSAR